MANELPILRTAIAGWRYGLAAAVRMRTVVEPAILLSVLVGIAFYMVTSFLKLPLSNVFVSALVKLSMGSILIVLFIPVEIAIYRYVLRDEITERYAIDPADPLFRKFLAVTFAVLVVTSGPGWAIELTRKVFELKALSWTTLYYAVVAAEMILATMLVLLFPAIASGSSRATWGNAIADAKENLVPIFLVLTLAVVPFFLFTIVTSGLAILVTPSMSVAVLISTGIVAVLLELFSSILTSIVIAGTASLLFAHYGRRLRGAA